jgi:hypothetical protein
MDGAFSTARDTLRGCNHIHIWVKPWAKQERKHEGKADSVYAFLNYIQNKKAKLSL